ncbi:PAS domain S-box protein [Desulfopila sp. IMCC35008]|uniref:PAS domain S-box protein n=1 Tax=Desulfopila sp. IMCC35008 TaxID=2653858 RepID=UPI0013D8568E|nr:PAS domain S-box protein [Desulfopila sp. IMCC35008]
MITLIYRLLFILCLTLNVLPAQAVDRGPQGVVRVGIFPFEPFNFMDANEVAQGLYPDLLREIVKNENWSVKFVPGSWAEGLKRLQKGEIDLILSVAYSPERAEVMDFNFESVAELWGQVFFKPNSKFKNINNLEGHRVAIMRKDISGSNFIATTEKLDVHCEIVEFPTHAKVFAAVQEGNVDAGVAPQHFGLRHAREFNLVGSSIMFSPFSIYFASKKGTQHELLSLIDAHLSRWEKEQNSFYYERLDYWLGNRSPKTIIPTWLIYASIFGTVSILAFAGFSLILKRTVNRRTRELQESEERMRLFFERQIVGMAITTAEKGWVKVNDRLLQMLGYSRDELACRTWEQLTHPEDIATDLAQFNRLLSGEIEEYSLEKRFIRKNGSAILTNLSVGCVRHTDSSVNFIVALVDDITERKQAEEELSKQKKLFETMFNTIPSGVIITNTNREIQLANKGMESTFGYNPNELLGKTTEMFYANQDHYQHTGVVVFGKKAQKQGDQYITYYRNKKGLVFPGETFGAKLFDEDGRWLGNLGIMRDITERIRQEDERIMLQKQLSHAQKMESIGALAGGIAHDFNNILGAVLGYAEMVQDDCPAGSTMRGHIDQVIKASHRAKELVKQILAFSRQTETEEKTLQPALIIKEAMKMFRASLPATIDIQQNIDPEVGQILADPTQIHQIVTNLCTNAFHAMEETGGTLTISLKNQELTHTDLFSEPEVQPGLFVHMSVSDTGSGIAPEVMKKIFDPYFTTKEVGKGTGMGLAIIHGIVKRSGGFVSCQSSPEEGTTFHVYLPINANTVSGETATEPVDLIQPGNERILFIDDEEMLAEMAKSMLERLGYNVTIKTNSIEALKTLQNQPDQFDLVITDQTMPGMTGSDLASRILQIRAGMPIILCTGFSNQISEEKARICGIKGFAMKPLAKIDLAALIRKVLDQQK